MDQSDGLGDTDGEKEMGMLTGRGFFFSLIIERARAALIGDGRDCDEVKKRWGCEVGETGRLIKPAENGCRWVISNQTGYVSAI